MLHANRSTLFRLSFAAMASLVIGAASSAAGQASRPSRFEIFDNLHNPNKPDLTSAGLGGCNIVYAGHVWPGAEKSPAYGTLPAEAAYKGAVRAQTKVAGPVVLDFEKLALSGQPEVAQAHFELFMTLVRWTHEAVPGHPVGFYGHGLFPEAPGKEYAAQAARLAASVDAFFPSMYTFDTNRDAWRKKAEGLVLAAHRIAPGKPVYFYVWPQFHGGTHAVLSGDQWAFELDAARDVGANGVVLWSGTRTPPWDDAAPWWQATLAFLKRP